METPAGAGAPERGWLTFQRRSWPSPTPRTRKSTRLPNIVSGVFDIYWNRLFQIPSLDAFDVSPEVLDRYVGVYSIAGTPAKVTFTRDGATLYFQPAGQSAAPLEATAENKFKIDPFVVFEFDIAKGQVTINRAGQARVFTKEK